MGRHAQPKNVADSSSDKVHPNRKWIRMLHALDYHRWHYVKKTLANKKHAEDNSVAGNNVEVLDACSRNGCVRMDACNPTNIEEKTKPSSPSKKGSRAARIKAMIAKEVSKKRGRHRRSSTCPTSTQLMMNNPVNYLENVDRELPVELILNNESLEIMDETIGNNQTPDEYSLGGPRKCELCHTMKIECTLGNKQFHKQVEDVECKEAPQENSGILKRLNFRRSKSSVDQLTRSSSFHQTNELLDAIDVLSLNKQFFFRVLEDPATSLAKNFVAQRVGDRKKELTRFGSFPLREPSGRRGLSSRKHRRTISKDIELQQCGSESIDSFRAIPSHPSRNGQGKQTVGRRFKDLREKVRHVIQESRKDRHRITMDAVLHKVPYGHKFPEDRSCSPQVNLKAECSFSPCRKERKRPAVRRTPSLDGSIDRYLQLFETTYNMEPRYHNSEWLRPPGGGETKEKSRKNFGRMFSSPDLESYVTSRDHNSNITLPYETLDKTRDHAIHHVTALAKVDPNNEEDSTDEEDTRTMTYHEEDTEDLEDLGDAELPPHLAGPLPELKNDVGVPESNSASDEAISEQEDFSDKEAEPSPAEQEASTDSPTSPATRPDGNDRMKALIHPLNGSFHHHVQVEAKDRADYDYVRDILRISGYSSNQVLGTWHSADQPLDPSIFVELELCCLMQPDCSGYEEGAKCNHLLLFDLINEVLLAMYERSMSYWPSPLSSCSRLHQMPKGYHVLEEVWTSVSWCLGSKPMLDSSLDFVSTQDLANNDGWMNLQFDAECVGLEIEDLILDDLLTEIISS
ncbi:hypothetical protein Drorol1_Dr00026076 [Drosera rotundifolia]